MENRSYNCAKMFEDGHACFSDGECQEFVPVEGGKGVDAKKIAAIKGSYFADKVRIAWVAELLARNGVQWPYASKDITDVEMLKAMWDRVIREHLAETLEKGCGE